MCLVQFIQLVCSAKYCGGLVMVCVGVCKCVSVCNDVCGCSYTGKQGIRSRCTIKLLTESSAIVCRVMLNAYSGVFDVCVDAT